MREYIERGRWYLSRLAAMDIREIQHRLRETAVKVLSCRRSRGWDAIPSVPVQWNGDWLRDHLVVKDERLDAKIRKEAIEVKAGRFNLLGRRWPEPSKMPPEPEFWHLEPESGIVIDRSKYCFRIPFRHGIELPEIKRVWELNRLQFLVPLAVNAIKTNDIEARSLIFGFIEFLDGSEPTIFWN